MEFYLVITHALRLERLEAALIERKPFLTLEFESLWNYPIYMFKCIIAAYGVKNLLPVYLTIALVVLNNLAYVKHEIFDLVYSVGKLNFTTFLQYLFNDEAFPLLLNAAIWYIGYGRPDFEFFLDIYVVLTVLFYVKKTYAGEYEKGCAVVFYLYSVSYVCDYIGKDQINFWHGVFFVYLPPFLLLLLKPVNSTARHSFFNIVVMTEAYLLIKFVNAVKANGMKENILYDGMADLFKGLIDLACKWKMELKVYILRIANAIYEDAIIFFNIFMSIFEF